MGGIAVDKVVVTKYLKIIYMVLEMEFLLL